MDYLDLYWLPVGAGTHFQRASLVLYEALAAALARRRRSTLCHAGLKACLGGRTLTLELTPAPAEQDVPPRMGGAVAARSLPACESFATSSSFAKRMHSRTNSGSSAIPIASAPIRPQSNA